jgi:CBS domain-containing protein
MSELGLHALLVVDSESVILGIVTGHDVLSRVVAAELDPCDVTVADVMTDTLVTISPDASLEEALKLMTECCHEQLIVTDCGVVCGLISLGDISRLLVDDRDALISDLTYYITHG